MLGSQALLHVLSAQRWHAVVDEVRLLVAGAYGLPPRPVDPVVRRAVELLGDEKLRAEAPQQLDTVREAAAGLATSEEELLLLALFDEEAEPLLRTIRARARGEGIVGRGVGETQAERVRELVDLVQESGIGEVTIEEGEMRITVRRSEEPAPATPALDQAGSGAEADSSEGTAELPVRNGLVRVESPMVGVFYRATDPAAPPFVVVGDTVERGQTLCLLEAMKLFNEVKAELDAVVRAIHVENATPVEYGQLLFELEPIDGSPPAGL
jgi:oxaloacetate decarboxylase alpha subunit